ncbi:hypothetical protein [Methylibium sp.]|uniref:hypothetical protein n=1 Tax=Methylibium sp. TaxID=2067992 RepID=UPI001800F37F|nr:hypothetical protein [Methylibium sp.]MBA3588497.1 hypothetical protein [Methylibium sp.]
MNLLCIDPGPTESAWLRYADGVPVAWAKTENDAVAALLRLSKPCRVAIEMVACYGMPVGREVFETCVTIGRFAQIAEDRGCTVEMVYRQEVKLHLCRSNKANDATIRQALLDRFGPGRDLAIGTKKAPGPLYGVSGDVWSALAVACTVADRSAASEIEA